MFLIAEEAEPLYAVIHQIEPVVSNFNIIPDICRQLCLTCGFKNYPPIVPEGCRPPPLLWLSWDNNFNPLDGSEVAIEGVVGDYSVFGPI